MTLRAGILIVMSARFGPTTSIREMTKRDRSLTVDLNRARREEALLGGVMAIFCHPDHPDNVFVRNLNSGGVYRLVGVPVNTDGVSTGPQTEVFA